MNCAFQRLLTDVRACRVCAKFLPHDPCPIVQISPSARILVIGQAPGRKVHESGVPWQDTSGDNLRAWLGVDVKTFYDPKTFALMPMGFCFPGPGKSGDLPPRPECAPLWHPRLLTAMTTIKLTLLVGQYSQRHYLGDRAAERLTETVRRFREFLPQFLPLPHPSPRNNIWMKKNPWFEKELLPVLKLKLKRAIKSK